MTGKKSCKAQCNESVTRSTFWLPEPVDTLFPEIKNNEGCDIAIIGGGISGLSTALHIKLLSPEKDVIVLESARIGYGPSGLSSGQCAPRVGPDVGLQILRSGRSHALLNYQYSLDSCEYLKNFIQSFDFHVDQESTEQWQISLSQNGYNKNIKMFHHYASLGIDLTFLDKASLQQKMPGSPLMLNAVSFPASFINPGLFCVSLKKLAVELGVKIFEQSTAEIDKSLLNGCIRVNGYTIKSSKVILAVDSAIAAMNKLFSAVHPILTFISVTRPLTGNELSSIGWHNRVGLYDNRKYFNFLRPVSHNRILIGGEYRYQNKRASSSETRQRIEGSLMKHLGKLFPYLKNIEPDFSWGGVSGCTLTGWPVVKSMDSANRCWQIGSWNGHGLALGFYAGKNLAEVVLNKTQRPPVTWPSSPGMQIPRWLSSVSIPAYLSWHKYYGNLSTK